MTRNFVRFSVFPDYENLNARHPGHASIWVWTYRLSLWDLNLGGLISDTKTNCPSKMFDMEQSCNFTQIGPSEIRAGSQLSENNFEWKMDIKKPLINIWLSL